MADRNRDPRTPRHSRHDWMIAVLIDMVEYAERNSLSETEQALTEAAERMSIEIKSARNQQNADVAERLHEDGTVLVLSDFR